MCLVFDIEEYVERNIPCCTRTDSQYSNGQNQCVDREAASRRCPMYSSHSGRRDATDAVREMLGGEYTTSEEFYIHLLLLSTCCVNFSLVMMKSTPHTGSLISKNNAPFYINFAKAWKKATTLGQRNLSPLKNSCEEV